MTASFDATGTLVRDGGGFALKQDDGGTVLLDLRRVPVDHVGKRVRVTGDRHDDGRVEAEDVAGLS